MSTEEAARIREYTQRIREQGLRRVSVWVPAEKTEALKDIAAQMRRDDELLLPADGNPGRSVSVPRVPGRLDAKTVDLESSPEEFGIHMLLRSNGGSWNGQRKVWEVPEWLPAKLGLSGRVRNQRQP